MPQYEIKGDVRYSRVCECKLCPGHNAYVAFTADIEAEDDQEAQDILSGDGEVIDELIWDREPGGINADTWEWVEKPTVQRITEDIRMRRLGAPMLPGMADLSSETRQQLKPLTSEQIRAAHFLPIRFDVPKRRAKWGP